jgi:hypothetical protein
MEHAIRPVWIDPSWLSWKQHIEATAHRPKDTAFRPYEVHQHASDRLEGNPSEFARVDAITTLRRAVGLRVKALKEIYQLRQLPTGAKPKYDLELLEYFGVIRPFMLKRLIDIRNMVEHQDSSPPPTDECLMFADLVWYFLRSTDGLIQGQVEEIWFVPPEIVPEATRAFYPVVTLYFREPFNLLPKAEAWLNPSSFSYEHRANWTKIESTGVTDYKETAPPRVKIEGKMHGTDEQMKLMYELYFRCSHFR